MSRTFIATDEPLGPEDPSLAWLRRAHPEKLEARGRPHEFVAVEVDPRIHGDPGPACVTCWAPRKRPWHRGGGR